MAWVRFGLAWLSSAKLGLRLGLGLGISLSLGLSLGTGLFSAPFSLAWSCSGSVSPQPALLSLAGFASHFNTFTNKNTDNLQNCCAYMCIFMSQFLFLSLCIHLLLCLLRTLIVHATSGSCSVLYTCWILVCSNLFRCAERESSVTQSKAERENEIYRVEVRDPERERGTEGMQANQCTNGGGDGCAGDNVTQNLVSMLQMKLQTNILKDDGQAERLLELTVLLPRQSCNV